MNLSGFEWMKSIGCSILSITRIGDTLKTENRLLILKNMLVKNSTRGEPILVYWLNIWVSSSPSVENDAYNIQHFALVDSSPEYSYILATPNNSPIVATAQSCP